MIAQEALQDRLDKLMSQCVTGNAEAIVAACLDLSREAGRLRAHDLLRSDLVRRGDAVIFDVGANIGGSSEDYRQMFPGAMIHAFEPHPQAFARLQERFLDDRRMVLNNCGVADRPGRLQFNLSSDVASSSFLEISPNSPYVRGIGLSMVETREVAVTCIDDYCQAQGIDHIDFMKLDVQGFERKVLDGASDLLTRHAIGAVQVEIVFRDFYRESSSFLEIEQCLQAYGYSLRCVYDIYPGEGAQIFQCDAIYAYSPKPVAAALPSGDPNQKLSEALAHQGAGRLGEARALYGELLEHFPENGALLALAGAIDLQEGRDESARELLRKALEVEPGKQDVAFRLGLAHFRLGEQDLAIGCLHGLADNGTAQLLLGQLYAEAGDHGAAVVALSRARSIGIAGAEEHLARALLNSGAQAEAETLLRQLVHPDRHCDRWLAMKLGSLLIEQGRGDEARRYFTDLVRARPELVDVALTVLADIDLAEGQFERALATVRPVMHSNWSRTFVSASLAQLGALLHDFGGEAGRRPHPFPGSTAAVAMTSLNCFGRFAHQLLEYLFLRWQADSAGLVLETPDWVGHLIFQLDDPSAQGLRRQVRRSSAWIEDQVARRGAQALADYDFFSPGTFVRFQPAHVDFARRLFKLRPCWSTLLDPALASLRGKCRTLVALHLRRTDQSGRYQLPQNRWYLEWLRQVWPKLEQPLLYVASDDLDSVMQDFSQFSPVCVRDLPGRIAGLEWLQDFHVLMRADAVAISQSAFSYLACMLNEDGRIFKQPDMVNGCLADYNPSRHDFLPAVPA